MGLAKRDRSPWPRCWSPSGPGATFWPSGVPMNSIPPAGKLSVAADGHRADVSGDAHQPVRDVRRLVDGHQHQIHRFARLQEVTGLRGLDADVAQRHVVERDLVAVDGGLLGGHLRDLTGAATGEHGSDQGGHADQSDPGAEGGPRGGS